jgi:uncharacterized membrane protein YhaH (DUF805 family)
MAMSFAQAPSDTTSSSTEEKDTDTQKVMKNPKSLVEDFMKMESSKTASDARHESSQDSFANDDRLDSIRLEAWKQYYGYMTKGYIHRSNVFSWQLLSSIIIFAVVIFLVFAGIYFAWLQFKASLRGSPGDSGQLSTELSASMKEIKVSSPVLGVIILVISLFFFYLYLVYVYPIQEIF